MKSCLRPIAVASRRGNAGFGVIFFFRSSAFERRLLQRHSGRDHLLVFIELGENEASVGCDVFAGLEPSLDDDVFISFLGDDELPPLELQRSIVICRILLDESVLVAVHDDHRQPGNHRLAGLGRDFEVARTSMSALSLPSTLGIEALILMARVSFETSLATYSTLPRQGLIEVRKTDFHFLPHRHSGLVRLIHVHPDEQVVEGSDHHEHVVVVVEIAWHGVALNDDAFDRREARHLRLIADRVQFLRQRLIAQVLEERVDLVFGHAEDHELFLGGRVRQATLAFVVLAIHQNLLRDRFLFEELLAHLEQPQVVLPLHVRRLKVVLGRREFGAEKVDQRNPFSTF